MYLVCLELQNAKIYGLVEQKHLEDKEILRPEDLNFAFRNSRYNSMLKNFKLKNLAGSLIGGANKSFKAEEINPRRDWSVILVSFIVVFIVIVAFGANMYWRINSGSFFITSGAAEISLETIDRSELKKVIERYETKIRLFQETKNKKPEIVDPSI